MYDVEKKTEIEKQIRSMILKVKILLQDFYPNKRFAITDEELVKKFMNIFEYIFSLDKDFKEGKSFSYKEICQGLFAHAGLDINVDELSETIDSMKLTNFLEIDSEGTKIKEYLVFFNNLIESSYSNKTNEELVKSISNINIPEIMGFYQFICSKLEENIKFLFKKPFRYTSKSVTELIDVYGTLSGYYEIFIKLMILANNLVHSKEPFQDSKYEQLSKIGKKNFNELIKITKRIPDFNVFREPYDRMLRNKIIHKDFRIDYKNKLIHYSSQKITFKVLLLKTRNLQVIYLSYSLLFTFDMRKNLQKAYNLLIDEEKIQNQGEKYHDRNRKSV